MSLLTFRFWLYVLTDYFYIVPVICAFFCWKKLSKGQKWLTFRFLIYFIVNVFSYFIQTKNLFLFPIYSLVDCICLFFVYKHFFQKPFYLKALNYIFTFAVCSLVLDICWITGFKNEENYFSEVIISLCVFGVSTFYFVIFLSNKIQKNISDEVNLFIALSLMITFFLKAVFSFFNKYLQETQSNDYLTAQFDNFYNFYVIISLLIVSWVFYQIRVRRTEILHE